MRIRSQDTDSRAQIHTVALRHCHLLSFIIQLSGPVSLWQSTEAIFILYALCMHTKKASKKSTLPSVLIINIRLYLCCLFTVCEWIATAQNTLLRSQHEKKSLLSILLKIILLCCQNNRK